MKKKSLVNAETDRSVPEFIASISNKVRKKDSEALLELMQEITGKEPKIWGTRIVGFGKYSYARKNGDEFDWFNVGFSPGKAHMTLYVMYDLEKQQTMLNQLGPHRHGRGCLYIKKLEDVDLDVLKEMIAKSDRWQVQ